MNESSSATSPPVEGDDHTTGFGSAEEDLDELGAVHQQCCHSVALLEPVVTQTVGYAVASLVEVDVGLALAAGDIDNGFRCRVQQRPLCDEQSDVVFHCGLASWPQIHQIVGQMVGTA